MIIKATKEHSIKNKNLILTGASGSGKTRFFIKPAIYNLENASFFVVTSNDNDFACDVRFSLDYEIPKLDFSKNLVASFNFFEDSKRLENLEKIITEIYYTNLEKEMFIIIDEAGSFNLSFLTDDVIEKLNEKGVYFAFLYQNLAQIRDRDYTKFSGAFLMFGTQEITTAEFCVKYGVSLEDVFNLEREKCYLIEDGTLFIDTKESFTSSTMFKYYRIKAGLSQTKLAELSGQTVRNIRAIENNPEKIQKMSAIGLYEISKILNCSIESLLEI